jgi:hypothetical protein
MSNVGYSSPNLGPSKPKTLWYQSLISKLKYFSKLCGISKKSFIVENSFPGLVPKLLL